MGLLVGKLDVPLPTSRMSSDSVPTGSTRKERRLLLGLPLPPIVFFSLSTAADIDWWRLPVLLQDSVSRRDDVIVGDWCNVDLLLRPPQLSWALLFFLPMALFTSPSLLADDSLIGRRRFWELCCPPVLEGRRSGLVFALLLDRVRASCADGSPVLLAWLIRTLGPLGDAILVDGVILMLGSLDAILFA